jgi:hypothetical protein
VSDERDKMGEPEEKFAKMGDVEAHKLQSRMGEPDEKFESDEDDVEAHKMGAAAARMGSEPDEKFESDEDDVEAHMLGSKHTPGKLQN